MVANNILTAINRKSNHFRNLTRSLQILFMDSHILKVALKENLPEQITLNILWSIVRHYGRERRTTNRTPFYSF